MSELNDTVRERVVDAVDGALSDLDADDFGLIEAEDVRDKLYDLTSEAESLAGEINYLMHADLGEVRDRIHEAEAAADQLAQALRDWHSEL